MTPNVAVIITGNICLTLSLVSKPLIKIFNEDFGRFWWILVIFHQLLLGSILFIFKSKNPEPANKKCENKGLGSKGRDLNSG